METRVEMPELPLIQVSAHERADAARNRERILCAAARLFAERGPSCVSMDDIAEEAGVGKGTLFRRFGSRAALAHAVLSEREIAFQEAIIRGEPPLGPGAAPAERLVAFGNERMDLVAENAAILLAAEIGPERLQSPPYAVYRLHIRLLLREADPDCDVDYLAEALLGCLGADYFVFLTGTREMELARLKAGWRELVMRIVAPAREPSLSDHLDAEEIRG